VLSCNIRLRKNNAINPYGIRNIRNYQNQNRLKNSVVTCNAAPYIWCYDEKVRRVLRNESSLTPANNSPKKDWGRSGQHPVQGKGTGSAKFCKTEVLERQQKELLY